MITDKPRRGRPPKNKIMPEENIQTLPHIIPAETQYFSGVSTLKEPALAMKTFAPAHPDLVSYIIIPFSKIERVETKDFQQPFCQVNSYRVAHKALDVLALLDWDVKRVPQENENA